MISSARGESAAFTRKDPKWGPFLPPRGHGLLVAASNATGHRRSIGAMDLRDLHGAVATCIRAAHVYRNARTVVTMTPVTVMPTVVTITPTILSGRRCCCYRHQRQRCQSDKSYLHSAFSSSDEVQRFLCFGVPKKMHANDLNNYSGFRPIFSRSGGSKMRKR